MENLFDLFNIKNLKFATKEDNRKPTLYFEDEDGNTGRIRQEHAKGSKISLIKFKRYFTTSKEDQRKFRDYLDQFGNKTQYPEKIKKDMRLKYKLYRKPKDKDYVVEVNPTCKHISGGSVVTRKNFDKIGLKRDKINQIIETNLNNISAIQSNTK